MIIIITKKGKIYKVNPENIAEGVSYNFVSLEYDDEIISVLNV